MTYAKGRKGGGGGRGVIVKAATVLIVNDLGSLGGGMPVTRSSNL